MIPKLLTSIKLNAHWTVLSRNANMATNAIKLERIPAIGPTIFDAPSEIASNIFLASLKFYHKVH